MKRMTSFTPQRNGFHFANSFVNSVMTIPTGWNSSYEIKTYGRCGGMAYAALDYFFSNIPIPTHLPADFQNKKVPHDGSTLADYIMSRLYDSWTEGGNVLKWISWTLDGDDISPGGLLEGKGVTTASIEDEFPLLRASIDQGKPVPLGLVGARSMADIGAKNHQVVATGYETFEGSKKFCVFIYDNNYPDQEIVLTYNPNTQKFEYSQGSTVWRGFFLCKYSTKTPNYKDLALSRGIWVKTFTPALGQYFDCQFNIKNVGQFDAHFDKIDFKLWGPTQQNMDGQLIPNRPGPTNVTLSPGQEQNLFEVCNEFGSSQGTYRLGAVYYFRNNCFDIPIGAQGTTNSVQLITLNDTLPKRVALNKIKIINDKDNVGAGEIYLRLTINGLSQCSGLMSINSGETRNLTMSMNINQAVRCVDVQLEVREDDTTWSNQNPFALSLTDMNKQSENLGTLKARFEKAQNYGRGQQVLKNGNYEITYSILD